MKELRKRGEKKIGYKKQEGLKYNNKIRSLNK